MNKLVTVALCGLFLVSCNQKRQVITEPETEQVTEQTARHGIHLQKDSGLAYCYADSQCNRYLVPVAFYESAFHTIRRIFHTNKVKYLPDFLFVSKLITIFATEFQVPNVLECVLMA